jgi:DNA-binding NtrC family response regulator
MAARLLIVEDEDTLRESLKRVFRHDGYEVDSVNSSETALQVLQSRHYDLIITDIVLPGIDGIELVRRCRKQNPDIVLVVITAFASIDTAVHAIRAGAYEYLVKPVNHQEIKAVVKKALEERQKAR